MSVPVSVVRSTWSGAVSDSSSLEPRMTHATLLSDLRFGADFDFFDLLCDFLRCGLDLGLFGRRCLCGCGSVLSLLVRSLLKSPRYILEARGPAALLVTVDSSISRPPILMRLTFCLTL